MTKTIYCCQCRQNVEARLTNGQEVYAKRTDLSKLPFWICDTCHNWVGCHHKTKNRTKPLGVIPSHDIKKARSHIHAILDPIWITSRRTRSSVYKRIAEELGKEVYHTADIRTIEEARDVYRIVRKIAKEQAEAQNVI